MPRTMFLALLLCAAALPARAAGDPMSAYYGNTLMNEHPGVSMGHFWYNRDHTFVHVMVDLHDGDFTVGTGDTAKKVTGSFVVRGESGAWSLGGTADKPTICRKLNGKDLPCVPLIPHKVGDHWQIDRPGGVEKFSLVAGHH